VSTYTEWAKSSHTPDMFSKAVVGRSTFCRTCNCNNWEVMNISVISTRI